MSQQLGLILQRAGMLTAQDLETSLRQATARNISLWELLIVERRIPEDKVADAFSRLLRVPRVPLESTPVESGAVKALPSRLARKHTCIPLRVVGRDLVLVMANPLDQQAVEDVQFVSGRQVRPAVASRSEILRSIEEHYPPSAAGTEAPKPAATADPLPAAEWNLETADVTEPPVGDTPAVNICHQIISDAIDLQASDIHIEPSPKEVLVRFRIDGVLRNHFQLPRWMQPALVSRIKILAKLDIAQQRLPQDGRLRIRRRKDRIDIRISTLPTQHGEKVVMRLLGSSAIPTLSDLGLSNDQSAWLDDALNQPQGLIIVTGPTGAGKSTTLYSLLERRRSPGINIVTVEDPIEYQVPGITQVQIDPKTGLTFANSLRAILRQDPDVILIGEIRDAETAEIAVQAALTGHLVLSTMHTNGSLAAIARFLDLGVRPLLLTTVTNMIVAQRLARRVCPQCPERYTPDADLLRKVRLSREGVDYVRGAGCPACGGTGYSGRVGVFELLRLTPQLKGLVLGSASELEMQPAATAAGTRFLVQDAASKVRAGMTTVEEVLRIIRIEQDDDLPGAIAALDGPP